MKEGDICNIDVTVYYDGHHGDLNETYFVGEVDAATKHLVQTSYESLFKGIELVKPRELYRNIGNAVSKHCAQNKCAVVRTYTGHGINSLFHTAPNVPHYAKNKAVGMMHPGQTFTIEPMVNAGNSKDFLWPDDWTAVVRTRAVFARAPAIASVLAWHGVEMTTMSIADTLSSNVEFCRATTVAAPHSLSTRCWSQRTASSCSRLDCLVLGGTSSAHRPEMLRVVLL